MILAVDQSLTNTGFVVINKGSHVLSGVISTKPEKKKRNIGEMDDKSRRTKHIINELLHVINSYSIKIIVCEEYSGFSQSKTAADALATSRTIIVAIASIMDIPMISIPIGDVKIALTGKKTATKTEMINAASDSCEKALAGMESNTSKNGWNSKAEHVADALGVYMASKEYPLIQMLEN